MTSATAPESAAAYLEQLRAELADLSPDERDDLLAEVEASLIEAAEEDEELTARLGPPAAFAADLRASAGLPPRLAAEPKRAPLRERLPAALARLKPLAPIWWVVRGYVAVAAFALATDHGWFASQPAVPKLGAGPGVSVLVIAAAIVASIAIGLSKKAPRVPMTVANAILAVALIPVLGHLDSRVAARSADASLLEQVAQMQSIQRSLTGLTYAGAPVRNVYPYDRSGHLLHDVRLYGANGQPFSIGTAGGDSSRRAVATQDGPVLNAFPIRYVDQQTGKVEHPDAGPRIVAPPLLTPPLHSR